MGALRLHAMLSATAVAANRIMRGGSSLCCGSVSRYLHGLRARMAGPGLRIQLIVPWADAGSGLRGLLRLRALRSIGVGLGVEGALKIG